TQAAAVALALDQARTRIAALEREGAELRAAGEQARVALAEARAAGEQAQVALAEARAAGEHAREALDERQATHTATIEGLRAEVGAADGRERALRAELDAAHRLIAAFEASRAVRAARLVRRVAPARERVRSSTGEDAAS
ncbi:MAG: hypothetical protein LBQ06_02280, partial [Frankiaceae bacterium]|nr:hypothetical protein [Frankiaceae bacterium]